MQVGHGHPAPGSREPQKIVGAPPRSNWSAKAGRAAGSQNDGSTPSGRRPTLGWFFGRGVSVTFSPPWRMGAVAAPKSGSGPSRPAKVLLVVALCSQDHEVRLGRSPENTHSAGDAVQRLVISESQADFTSQAGLGLVGMAIRQRTSLAADAAAVAAVRSNAMPHGDILASYGALLCMGKSDFEAIDAFRADAYFHTALGLGQVPSAATLRQRLDAHAVGFPECRRAQDAKRDVKSPFRLPLADSLCAPAHPAPGSRHQDTRPAARCRASP